ncbi:MAG: Sec-independent protein secretion pathway component TatC [Candidatus Promineifilaceae bacterium]|jgi:Sec-independent protein secretion pathway component TatC
MNSNQQSAGIDTKVLLSTLWLFVLLNMIFRDIHEIGTVDFLEQAMTGVFNGTVITDKLLLFAGILLELPIAMVLFSRILRYRINRWLNLITALIMFAAVISSNLAPDLDDAFFAAVELLALFFIAWKAWGWSNPEIAPSKSTHLTHETEVA